MSLFLQAIVFDYDGVLADTEPLHLGAFQETLAPRGIELSRAEYYERYLGLDDHGVFRALLERRGTRPASAMLDDLVADKALRFRRHLAATGAGVLFPGVVDRLAAWSRHLPLAIASGSPRAEIEPVLAAAGLLEAVWVIVALGETARAKPHPDPYLRAMELLAKQGANAVGASLCAGPSPGYDAGRCVAVEDSPFGIAAARAAGLKVVALATGHAPDRLCGADAVLARFEELDLERLDHLVCRPPAPRP